MREDVNCVNATATFQGLRSLQHAVLLRIDEDDFDIRLQSRGQRLPAGQPGVNNRDPNRHFSPYAYRSSLLVLGLYARDSSPEKATVAILWYASTDGRRLVNAN